MEGSGVGSAGCGCAQGVGYVVGGHNALAILSMVCLECRLKQLNQKLLWCHSYLVWLVFEGPIPTCACFLLENFFVTCSCCFSFVFFRDCNREVTWEGRPRERCMLCTV